jgi:hypothetical protein
VSTPLTTLTVHSDFVRALDCKTFTLEVKPIETIESAAEILDDRNPTERTALDLRWEDAG